MKNINQDNEENKTIQAVYESTYGYEDPDSPNPHHRGKRMITHDHDLAEGLITIDKLVHAIIESNEILFTANKNRRGEASFIKTRLGDHFLSILKLVYNIYYKLNRHKFSPYIDLFIRQVSYKKTQAHPSILDIYTIPGYGLHYNSFDKADALNDCIDRIRNEARSEEFKKSIKNHNRSSKINGESLEKYIKAIYEIHARVLVLRIDLGYRQEYSPRTGHENAVKYPEAKNDREHFFNNMRSNELFDHMVGYAWKLEYGFHKGFHFHMLFFFDGSKVRGDIVKAKMIGEYWKKIITKGKGLYYNCNANKEKYGEDCGIGMIKYNDTELMENLITKTSVYLTKADYYARIIDPDIDRTFGKGEMPAPKTSNRGRPRTNPEAG